LYASSRDNRVKEWKSYGSKEVQEKKLERNEYLYRALNITGYTAVASFTFL